MLKRLLDRLQSFLGWHVHLRETPKSFARRNDFVTRENGQLICIVKRDLYEGDATNVNDFFDWQIEPPAPGSAVGPRQADGTSWVAQHEGGLKIFINGQWRP